jgi:hypothetical protein
MVSWVYVHDCLQGNVYVLRIFTTDALPQYSINI